MKDDSRARELIETLLLMKKTTINFHYQGTLRGPQIAILSCIFDNTNDEHNEMKPSQISAILNLQQPTISPNLKDLEKLGFINRRNDDLDRRQVYYSLTQTGKTFIVKHRKHELEMFKGLSNYLGDEDTDKFIEILRKIVAYMKNRDRHSGDNTGGNIC